MPPLHFEHTPVPLLHSQKGLKTIHYQAPFVLFKNEPKWWCRAQTHCPLQTAQGCVWWCHHIPEERTGPWRHLSLPLLHHPSRDLPGNHCWYWSGVCHGSAAISNPKIFKIHFIMRLTIMETKSSFRLVVFFHATMSSNTSDFVQEG